MKFTLKFGGSIFQLESVIFFRLIIIVLVFVSSHIIKIGLSTIKTYFKVFLKVTKIDF